MRKYAARIDGNQPGIVAALRKAGAHVVICSAIGGGFPDLLILKAGRIYFVEVKNPDKPKADQELTKVQIPFHETFAKHGWTIHIVKTIAGALEVIGQ